MINKICYDFLTFTSKIHSITSIIELLGLEKCSFETLKGFYGYRDRLYFDGISIHYNGRDDMGLCVELSGKGCRTFETFGNGDYDLIFSEILDNYNDNSELRQMNITRLDIAYDDFIFLRALRIIRLYRVIKAVQLFMVLINQIYIYAVMINVLSRMFRIV